MTHTCRSVYTINGFVYVVWTSMYTQAPYKLVNFTGYCNDLTIYYTESTALEIYDMQNIHYTRNRCSHNKF